MRRIEQTLSRVVCVPVIMLGAVLSGCAASVNDRTFWRDDGVQLATLEQQVEPRFALLYFTADWCVPCKEMERTVWPDPRIEAWIAEHAVAYRIDIDRDSALFEHHMLSGVPTIIVYRDGEHFDLITGARTAEQMLHWFEQLAAGSRLVDRLLADLEQVDPNDEAAQAELIEQIAAQYALLGEHRRAEQGWKWLFERRATEWERRARSQHLIELACRQDHGIRQLIERWVDVPDPNSDEADDGRAWMWVMAIRDDWITIEMIIEGYGRTEWMRELLSFEYLFSVTAMAHVRLWDDLLWYYDGPGMAAIAEIVESEARVSAMIVESGGRWDPPRVRLRAAVIHAALLRAGREAEATAVASALLRHVNDAPSRMMLVEEAIRANEPRREHGSWLQQAAERGAETAALEARWRDALSPGV